MPHASVQKTSEPTKSCKISYLFNNINRIHFKIVPKLKTLVYALAFVLEEDTVIEENKNSTRFLKHGENTQ